MKLLEQVEHGRKPRPRRIMLYGVQGIGKTTWGAMAPDSLLMRIEDGADDIDCSKTPLITTCEQALEAISEITTEAHAYRSLVIDTLDALEALVWADVCRAKAVANIEEIGYGKGYNFALGFWREFLARLSKLRDARGMVIILIAHSKIEKFQNPETDGYDRYSPKLHKTAAALVQEWCDEVLFATYKVYTRSVEEGFNRKVNKGIGGDERVLKTTEQPAHMAKNRLNLPKELPLAWAEYAKFLN